MKPTFEINPKLFANESFFTHPYFKKFKLRKAEKPLQLTEAITKYYLFPTLYGDVTCAIGIFLCDYKKAQAIMPHPKIKPVRMTKGRSLVNFSCYQYRNVMGVAPYNEIAMTIPVLAGDGADIPVLPMIMSGAFKNFGYYVFGMPVTSKENEIRGQKIWGLPKLTQEIEMSERDGNCVTVAKDSNGKPYFELSVPMSGSPTKFDVSGKLYSKLNGNILRAETNFCGEFLVTKFMDRLFKKGGPAEKSVLKVSDCTDSCDFSKILNSLDIEPQPFQFRYAKTMNSAFDLPEQIPVFSASASTLPENPKVTIFGAGAVGASVGGWLAANYNGVSFYDLPAVRESLSKNGITLYCNDAPEKKEKVSVKTVDTLAGSDVIVLAVKTYSLEKVAQLIKDQVGDNAIIVALQNGIDNQTILSKYFSKVIYGIVSYNAWLDSPGVVGFQKRGPLILGTIGNTMQNELHQICTLFSRGVETIATDRLQDAARSKMVVNLTNSFATLVGHRFREISDPALFQKLLTNLTFEGVQILKAAGYKEARLGGMPSWLTMTAAATLPPALIRPLFNKNVKKMVLSSMAQDILQRGGTDSELDSLNGYFIQLADKHGVKAPFNRAVYALCKEHFGKPGFKPIDVKDVWDRVQKA